MQIFKYQRIGSQKETLLSFVTKRFRYQKEEVWQQSIITGKLQVNSATVASHYILQSNDQIMYHRRQEEEPPIDPSFTILFEEENFLVVEKNPSIPVSPSGMYFYNTLLYTLEQKQGYEKLHAVHRLDKETSGVLIIAKNKETARRFGKQFTESKPKKTYYAILKNYLEKEIIVDKPIGKASNEGVFIRQSITKQGKPSQTRFIPKKTDSNLTLTKIIPYTGRTHQIRCHAHFIGMPVLGDKLYGQNDADFVALLKGTKQPIFPPYGYIATHLLHAFSISFLHPFTNQELYFTSDYIPFWEQISCIAKSHLLS